VTALEKAVLEELDRDGKVIAAGTVTVQFNPASLKLATTNSIDGAKSRGRQVQQYNGTASTTLSVQLEFDTADEGSTAQPVNVRSRTAAVARFVLPGGSRSKQAPPRVRFRWGAGVTVAGVMTSMSEELDLFSAHGMPLRATVHIEIKEQDPKYEARADLNTGAQPAGERSARPGRRPPRRAGDRTIEALEGESAADFLARNGLDPAAWRAIAAGLPDPLSLPAGLPVDFPTTVGVTAGIGATVGFGAAVELSVAAALGLDPAVDSGIDPDASGFALAEAGGVTAAGQAAAAAQAGADANRARAAFGAPAPASGPAGAAGGGRAALAAAPSARTLGPVPSPAQPPPPQVDPRAVTFGRGVPLRDRISPAGAGAGGYVVVGQRAPGEPPDRAGSCGGGGCGCGGRCGCGGGRAGRGCRR
jgi:hypothetical protein